MKIAVTEIGEHIARLYQVPMAVLPDDPVGVGLTKEQSELVDTFSTAKDRETFRQFLLETNLKIREKELDINLENNKRNLETLMRKIRNHICQGNLGFGLRSFGITYFIEVEEKEGCSWCP